MHFPFFSRKKNEKGLIGVDFRANRVAVAHILYADKSTDKPKLKQCAFETLSGDDASASEVSSQSQALTQLVKPLPSDQFYCNSSIEPASYELLLIDTPTVDSSELKQAVRWRIKDQLSYHIDDSILDVFEIPGQPSGRAQLIYVVASQKQKINERVEQIKGVNLSLQSIDIYELAQRNIASILPEDKDGIVMLRFNEGSGLLTITRNSTLFLTRRIDFDINRLTQVLTSGIDDHLSHSHEIAEEIELSLDEASLFVGEEKPANKDEINEEPCLNDEGKLIIDEVILEIQRSLDYYVSHFNQHPVAKVILAPAPEVPGIVEYINDMLGIQVEVLDFNQLLDIAKPLSRELQAHCFDAIGLALRKEKVQGAEG